MSAFCGINYEDQKSMTSMTVNWADGNNVRAGIEISTALVKKLENGETVALAGETFRARCGSIRIMLADGSGYTSVFSAEGTPFFNPPATPAVNTSTGATNVSFVTVHVRSYRYLAAYRVALKKLGFTASTAPVSLPAAITFETSSGGVPFAALEESLNALQATHLAKDFAYPKPPNVKSEAWWRYELWLQYKKEVSVWAD